MKDTGRWFGMPGLFKIYLGAEESHVRKCHVANGGRLPAATGLKSSPRDVVD